MNGPSPIVSEIIATRLARKLSQSALAKQAGIPLRTYQRLESDAGGAKLETLMRALDTLGLTIKTASKRRPTLDELDELYGNE